MPSPETWIQTEPACLTHALTSLALTGVVLVVTAPRAKQSSAVTPIVGIGYLGAQGSF